MRILLVREFNTYFNHIIVGEGQDVCDDYQSIPELPFLRERVINYTLAVDETPVCDAFLPLQWYRTGHFVLTASAWPCGTIESWYLNGKYILLH